MNKENACGSYLSMIGICVCILFAGAFPTEAQKKATIAVLPFTVNSQENIDYVKQGVWDMLISRLSMTDSLSVISKDQVSGTIQDLKITDFSLPNVYTVGKS